jgi:prepilin-type N-terminal cleavage/methylation domain-containing protein
MEKKYLLGLTLVELMIVMAIVAILAALIIANFTGQVFKGNDAKRKGDLDRIKIAAEEYEKDHNCYPDYITCGVHPGQPVHPYLNNVPCDPVTNASYIYEHDGSVSCPEWFRSYTVLQYSKDISIIPNIGPGSLYNYLVSSANAPRPPTPTPFPSGEGVPDSGFYGCKSGACVAIPFDPIRPGPQCDPNYQSRNCYGQCGTAGTECIDWN